jgi:hypothetical protein
MSKRAYIPLPERLAAALVCLLPPLRRDELRRYKASADDVIALFQFDHIRLYALERNDPDVDRWFNLDPKDIGSHKTKSATDTGRVAKVKRIVKKQAAHAKRMTRTDAAKLGYNWPKWRKPKRKIPSRPFPKTQRKMRSRRP